MNLDERDIEEFASIWREEFGETLSKEEARLHASQLMELYLVLAEQPAVEAELSAEESTPHQP